MCDAGRDADNAAALLLPHGWNESAAAEKVSAEIDIDSPVPIFFGNVHDQRFQIYARVINEDIDATEAVKGFIRQSLHGNFAGDVHFHSECLGSQTLDLIGNIPGFLRLQIGDHDLRPLAS